MGKIRWSEKASSNLQSIYDYIARDSRTYAARFVRSLVKSTLKLEEMPYAGRIVSELDGYGFREVIFQSYRIVYRIEEISRNVEILAVVHGAREMRRALHGERELE